MVELLELLDTSDELASVEDEELSEADSSTVVLDVLEVLDEEATGGSAGLLLDVDLELLATGFELLATLDELVVLDVLDVLDELATLDEEAGAEDVLDEAGAEVEAELEEVALDDEVVLEATGSDVSLEEATLEETGAELSLDEATLDEAGSEVGSDDVLSVGVGVITALVCDEESAGTVGSACSARAATLSILNTVIAENTAVRIFFLFIGCSFS